MRQAVLCLRRLRTHRRTRTAKRDAVDGRRCGRLRSADACQASRQPARTRTPKAQCTSSPDAQPARAEFLKVAGRTGLGFIVMGLIGFFVKLVLCVHRRTLIHEHGLSKGLTARRRVSQIAAFPSTTSSSAEFEGSEPCKARAPQWRTFTPTPCAPATRLSCVRRRLCIHTRWSVIVHQDKRAVVSWVGTLPRALALRHQPAAHSIHSSPASKRASS